MTGTVQTQTIVIVFYCCYTLTSRLLVRERPLVLRTRLLFFNDVRYARSSYLMHAAIDEQEVVRGK